MRISKNVLYLCKRQQGFTLIECIFSLLITSIILTLFPLMIITFNRIDQSLNPNEVYEWNLFLIQLRKEMRISEEWKVENNRLELMVDGQQIAYEKYGNVIRRRVNDTGHEIVLQNVDTISFEPKLSQIKLSVLFNSSRLKEAKFSGKKIETAVRKK